MKKILVMLALAAGVFSAQASYLYWQLTGDESVPEGVEFTHAIVWATKGEFGSPTDTKGTALTSGVVLGSEVESVGTIVENWDAPGQSYVIDVSTYSTEGYSFYIELKNYDSATAVYKTVGFLQGDTYANMVTHSYIDTGLSLTPAAVWHGGTYAATPEPTSAMMILFGLAGLALRRRRA